jgi:hypothetical protein
MTATGIVISSHRDLGTEKLTVVALVAQATVEAALRFSDGQAGTNFKIYLCKRLDPFLTQEAGLGNHGRELEIFRIEIMVADDPVVA